MCRRGGRITVYCKHKGTFVTSVSEVAKKLIHRAKGYLYVDIKEVNDKRIQEYKEKMIKQGLDPKKPMRFQRK